MEYRQIQVIGGKGNAPGQFATSLRSLAVDTHGQIFAAGDSEIKVFDAAGRLKRRWSTSRPVLSVAVAADGAVYAGQLRQIEIFDGAGKLVNTWRDETLLGRVTAIGFVKDGVLAGDAADRAIRHFDRGNHRFRNNIGKDNPVHGFLIPNGVVDFAVDADGVIRSETRRTAPSATSTAATTGSGTTSARTIRCTASSSPTAWWISRWMPTA